MVGRGLSGRASLREVDVAAPVVAWLGNYYDNVFQEVKRQTGSVNGTADIVAIQRRGRATIVSVVEVKTVLNLTVLAQAVRWLHCSHYTWVATPKYAVKGHRESHLVKRILQHEGVGWLLVGRLTDEEARHGTDRPSADTWRALGQPGSWGTVSEVVPAPFHRRVNTRGLLADLTEEQKTFALAGSPGGKSWTPWRASCTALAEYVRAHPGATLGEVIQRVPTHYATMASARHNLLGWIRAGRIPGVEARTEGGAVRLYLREETNHV